MNWATLIQSATAVGTGEDVTELAIAQLDVCDAPELAERVANDLRARTSIGVERYGFPLRCDNGRTTASTGARLKGGA